MRLYLDSSALVKRVFEEVESDALEDLLERAVARGDELVTSELSRIEVMRALRRRIDDESLAALAESDRAGFAGVSVNGMVASVISLARRIGPPALRSLDAIHLATAVVIDVDVVISYDARQRTVAEELGFEVYSPH